MTYPQEVYSNEVKVPRINLLLSASEVALHKKRNGSESLPIKVRSFAKKMDDTSKYTK